MTGQKLLSAVVEGRGRVGGGVGQQNSRLAIEAVRVEGEGKRRTTLEAREVASPLKTTV